MDILAINTKQQQLENFFAGLSSTIKSAKEFQRHYDPVMAFEFNPMLLFFPLGENKLSSILAFFLDPTEKHGQGDIFLKLFLRQFNITDRIPPYISVKVKCEHPIDNSRRLDLLLVFDDRYAVCIENKIWAKDQKDQLKDYSNYLATRFQENHYLIYLTPYGHRPTEYSISKADFDELEKGGKMLIKNHWQDITQLIDLWISNCKADKVRNFLRDLEQYLQHEINGEQFMNEHEIIKSYVLDKAAGNRLDIALSVASSIESVKQTLWADFKDQMIELASELDLNIEGKFEFKKEKDCFCVFNEQTKAKNLAIGFSFEDWKFFYGIRRFKFDQPVANNILEFINASVDPSFEEATKDWPWWVWDKDFAIGSWHNPLMFSSIHNGKVKEKVKALIQNLLEQLQPILN